MIGLKIENVKLKEEYKRKKDNNESPKKVAWLSLVRLTWMVDYEVNFQ